MQKRRPGGGGAVLPTGERDVLTRDPYCSQEPRRGWNFLTLGGNAEAARLADRRRLRLAQPTPRARPSPKPTRPVLRGNEAMRRKLEKLAFLPWWAR